MNDDFSVTLSKNGDVSAGALCDPVVLSLTSPDHLPSVALCDNFLTLLADGM